jgi:hypothetical protein
MEQQRLIRLLVVTYNNLKKNKYIYNMKRYIRDGIVKYQNEIVVYADDMQVFNPSEDLLLEWGWKEYTIQELNDE